MNIQELWSHGLACLQEELGSRTVETWFKAVVCVAVAREARTVYLRAPNIFVRDWVVKNYLPHIEKVWERLIHVEKLKIAFVDTQQVNPDFIPARPLSSVTDETTSFAEVKHVRKELNNAAAVASKITPAINTSSQASSNTSFHVSSHPLTPSARVKTALRPLAKVQRPAFSQLYTQYTFDTFVEGPHNTLAYHAARAVSEEPGGRYNPFFIYGPSGHGKTHLLHALAHAVRQRFPSLRILYQPADRFVHDFIQAIRQQKMTAFGARYQETDFLLIDDIQCIADKEQTQEAFFRIFNLLHQAGKQIVCSSDTAPDQMHGFADRMRTRFTWGLVADICQPPFETRIAIVKKKAELQGHELSDDVAAYIAQHFSANIRALEGALTRLLAYAQVTKQDITLSFATKIFESFIAYPKESGMNTLDTEQGLSLEQVAKVVSAACDIPLERLRMQGREKETALARHVAMYCMKQHTKASLKSIGAFFARKDHSTVLHAYEKIERMRQQNNHTIVDLLERIEKQLTQ